MEVEKVKERSRKHKIYLTYHRFRLRLSILPLRFNIDQDAVQFIMKFLLSGKKTEKERGDTNKERDGTKPTKSKRSSSMTTTPAKAQEMMFFQSCEIKPLRIF